ncbi:MAG: VOC family protein [Thermoplasmata archaeon]|nr:VOC family protein [Thermoplasmata archaeon]
MMDVSSTPEKEGSQPNPKRISIGSIVVDCTKLDQMIAFWSEALHYVPQGPIRPDGVMLKDPKGGGPNLNMSLSSEGPLAEYRLHLDLYVTDPLAEAERLIGLGATMNFPAEKGRDFVTLADPDGNLFCLIDIDWPAERNSWADDWEFGRRT